MIPSLSASPNLLAKTYKGFKTSKCLKYSFWPVMKAHKLAKSLKIFVKNDTAIKYFQCFVRRHHPEERQEQFRKFTAGDEQDIFRQILASYIRSTVRLKLA